MAKTKAITREGYTEHILCRVYQLFTCLFTAGVTGVIVTGHAPLFTGYCIPMYGLAIVLFCMIEHAQKIDEGCKDYAATFAYHNVLAVVCLAGSLAFKQEGVGWTILPALAAAIMLVGMICMTIQGERKSKADTFSAWSKMNKEVNGR